MDMYQMFKWINVLHNIINRILVLLAVISCQSGSENGETNLETTDVTNSDKLNANLHSAMSEDICILSWFDVTLKCSLIIFGCYLQA